MQDHRKVRVWWKAHRLLRDLERLLAGIKRIRAPGLRNQTLRAAESIPRNIVEGCGADSQAEFARFLGIALKSVKELEYHIQRLHEVGAMSANQRVRFEARVTEVRRMLFAFRESVRRQARKNEH
jgi:four helix bundle protein